MNEIYLSVIILAKNESARILKCIQSVSFADEIIVIDNESIDDTANLARQNKAIVIPAKTMNFSELRMLGKNKSHGEWLLYIDADELVSDKLSQEIKSIVHKTSKYDGFFIPRKNFYLGREWPTLEKLERLFKSKSLKKWIGALHESPVIEGKLGILKNPIIHNTHRSLEEMIQKTNEWSRTEAMLRYNSNHPPIKSWRLFRVMISGFYRSYIKEQGWRAGTVGLIESIYQAFSMFITYSKLWEMQKKF